MESPNRRRSASFNSLVTKTVVPDAIISPTIAHRKDYCSSSHTNASSMLNQNVPKTPRSYTQFTYEPSYSQMLVHSGLLQHVRHRHISENRALATWLSLMIIKGKLVLDDPGIVLDELELLHGLTYHLTKSFQVLNPPTAVVLVAFLYFCRIFPKEVRYSGNPDDECSIALARLFLLCLRLAAQWFEDQCEFFDFRGRRFQWFEYLGLTKVVFRNADIQILHLLDHNLCVSNVSYAHWLSHLLSSLPEYLGNYPEERCAISQLIHAIRPTLTTAFLHADRLRCPGLPFNKEWRPPLCFSAGEFEERGRDLVDCVTFGLAIPLPVPRLEVIDETASEASLPVLTSNIRLSVLSSVQSELSWSSVSSESIASAAQAVSFPPKCNLSPGSDLSSLGDFKRHLSLERSQLPKSPFPTRAVNFSLQSASKALFKRIPKLWNSTQ